MLGLDSGILVPNHVSPAQLHCTGFGVSCGRSRCN